jgi:tetratricopeptide (TPR) repeat protein
VTEAVGLAASSELARWSGDRDRAIAMKEQVIPSLFALGEVGWATAMMIDLVHIYAGRGEIERAASLSEEALSIRREIGDQTGVAHALEAAAQVRWAQGGRDEALAMLEEATGIWDGSGFRGKASECRAQLADIERRLGRLAEARANFVDALSTAADEDNVFVELCSLRDIGSLAVDEGRPARAARIWGATATLLTKTGLSLDEAPSDYLEKLGAARRLLGDSEFDREWHAGGALSRDEAVALALLGLSDQL